MKPPKRKRNIQLNFRVSPEEQTLIEQKMYQFGTKNREAYLRKMALDGYVVHLELPELKELVSLMRRSSNNINQLTRRAHETGRIYNSDLKDISRRQEKNMGRRERNTDPAFQTLVTDIGVLLTEEEAALFCRTFLCFSFYILAFLLFVLIMKIKRNIHQQRCNY